MNQIKFRAKAVVSVKELDDIGIEHENGWVVGNLIADPEPYIIGGIVEATDDYINPEYWVQVVPETIEQLGIDLELQKLQSEISESHGLHLSTVIELQRITTMVSGIDYDDKRVGVALAELENKFQKLMKKWSEN